MFKAVFFKAPLTQTMSGEQFVVAVHLLSGDSTVTMVYNTNGLIAVHSARYRRFGNLTEVFTLSGL
jgi:hypothetical protein